MTAETIDRMAWYMPYSKETLDLPADPSIDTGGLDLRRISHYLHCYGNLAFGWKLAYTLARSGHPFPPGLEGRDLWVYRAYLWAAGYSQDPFVEAAMGLNFRRTSGTCDKLNAILVARDGSPAAASAVLGMDMRLVTAYETLFYNVTDRRDEGRFLSEIVYPQGRYVELLEGYLRDESMGRLLMRSGYNNGLRDLLYMAGMPGTSLESSFTSAEQGDKLESYIMLNGYALARAGLLNQHGVPGLSHARQVMQAIKQGGDGAGGSESPLSGAGDSILEELKRVKGTQASRQAGMRRNRSKAA